MAKHNDTGRLGEQIAANYLADKGCAILHTNWRAGRAEVDIIALHGDRLIFAEVKTRRSTGYGFPEEAVTKTKQAALSKAANAYLEQFPSYGSVRFDIISVVLQGDAVLELIHLEDCFYG